MLFRNISAWLSGFTQPGKIARKPAITSAVALAMVALPFVGSLWGWNGPAHACAEGVGIFCILWAIVGRCWTTLYIGDRKNRDLLTRGPYSVVRNPFYSFSVVGAFGMGACSGSMVIAAIFAAIAILFFLPIARYEDAELARRLGCAFDAYRATVPRFFPAPHLWRQEEALEVTPARIGQTFLDALPFLLAVPVFEMIGALQHAGMLPVLVRLP